MRKGVEGLFLVIIMVLVLCGCGKDQNEENHNNINIEQEEIKNDEVSDIESESTEITETQKNDTAQNEQIEGKTTFIFSDLKYTQFVFSSGAGAWSTMMTIGEDGSFKGTYHDSDMGSVGEGYPNGTRYYCEFTGQFTEPVKVNDYTYSVQISEIQYADEVGKEEILDGVLYCYSDAYGLEGAKDILIYLPGAPMEELPESFKSWIGASYYEPSDTDVTELPYYGLYNVEVECGFESYDLVESLEEMLSFTEELAAELENSIRNDDLTQVEYNEKSKQLYDMWDSDLNTIWNALKSTLDAETMEDLLAKQREWIVWKEEEIAKAGAEFEGGSMQPMVMHQKAAELTKIRVYELMEYFE